MLFVLLFLSLVICGIISASIMKSPWGFVLGFTGSILGIFIAVLVMMDEPPEPEVRSVNAAEPSIQRQRPDNGSSFPPADNFPPGSGFP